MNEKKINRITANLMFSIVNSMESNKENWMEVYASICAVKQIIERSPVVHQFGISPEEGEVAEQIGKKLGIEIANEADNVTKNYRN